ncbi:hypothetical protein H181DRAFT_04708 [Streptomyces sp. WMMB 714]|uniref:hypothetical protein n=1 Tax=Streptomyces sp. WMMB 714 TaxID=1286822 RepID=UPI0005F7F323|nr:hypothetical protein [Streptomyces sp. WMMB 714]SCK51808.1 hypothetical protein H181DRAFT_04708 [Streptomyces sp. WMMB 714]
MAATARTQHLATIDLLRARPFPARRRRSARVTSGPGYHVAELVTSEEFWEDDGTARIEALEECEAERGALSAVLAERWGEPQEMSLWSTLVRSGEGAPAPQPWLELSAVAACLELWRVDGRWIALGVCQQSAELPFQLVAAVTVNDPP